MISNDMVNTKLVRSIVDDRGNLSVIESDRDVPFPIKRVYYLWGCDEGTERGYHAHKSLQQAFIAVHGKCILTIDNSSMRSSFEMVSPGTCVIINSGLWREISSFSSDCVLLVLASEYYDEKDYIRDYEEYLRYARKQQ